jgi:flagellar export protein FliJ
MRRFRFALDPLLRLRGVREEQAEIALAAAQRRRGEAIERAELLARELARWREARAVEQAGALDMAGLAAAISGEQALESEIRRQEERIAEAEAGVRAAADHLRHCRIARETLEQFRERRRAEHARALASEEQQFLDETAAFRFWGAADRDG